MLPEIIARMNSTPHTVTKVAPVSIRPTAADLAALERVSVSAAAGLPEAIQSAQAPTRAELEAFAVRNTVKVALRMETSVPASARHAVGDRVYVKNPRPKKTLPFGFVAYAAAARVAEVSRHYLYRLLWISEGLDGEQPGTVSARRYHHRELKPVGKDTPTAALLNLAKTSVAPTVRDRHEIVAVLGVYDNLVLVHTRGVAEAIWVERSELPSDILDNTAPVTAATWEQAQQLQANFNRSLEEATKRKRVPSKRQAKKIRR